MCSPGEYDLYPTGDPTNGFFLVSGTGYPMLGTYVGWGSYTGYSVNLNYGPCFNEPSTSSSVSSQASCTGLCTYSSVGASDGVTLYELQTNDCTGDCGCDPTYQEFAGGTTVTVPCQHGKGGASSISSASPSASSCSPGKCNWLWNGVSYVLQSQDCADCGGALASWMGSSTVATDCWCPSLTSHGFIGPFSDNYFDDDFTKSHPVIPPTPQQNE